MIYMQKTAEIPISAVFTIGMTRLELAASTSLK